MYLDHLNEKDGVSRSTLKPLTWINTAVKNGITSRKRVIFVSWFHFDSNVKGWSIEKRPFRRTTVALPKPLAKAIDNGHTETKKQITKTSRTRSNIRDWFYFIGTAIIWPCENASMQSSSGESARFVVRDHNLLQFKQLLVLSKVRRG